MFRSIATILSFSAFLTLAKPAVKVRQAAGPKPTSTVPVPARYQLRSKVIPGTYDCGTDKNDLFVFSYHTGAGLGVAALHKTPSTMWGYLNGTSQLFTYEGSAGPWPMVAAHAPYRDFNEISISIAGQTSEGGFFFNESGLQLQGNNGWIACDFWYENPQIFALNGLGRVIIPKSCSRIDLTPVAC